MCRKAFLPHLLYFKPAQYILSHVELQYQAPDNLEITITGGLTEACSILGILLLSAPSIDSENYS